MHPRYILHCQQRVGVYLLYPLFQGRLLPSRAACEALDVSKSCFETQT